MERAQRIALQEEVVQMRTQLNQVMKWMQSFAGSGLSSSSSVPVGSIQLYLDLIPFKIHTQMTFFFIFFLFFCTRFSVLLLMTSSVMVDGNTLMAF